MKPDSICSLLTVSLLFIHRHQPRGNASREGWSMRFVRLLSLILRYSQLVHAPTYVRLDQTYLLFPGTRE